MSRDEAVPAEGRHTPGPWVVHVTEHPHHLGGKHKEFRIFTAWDHPQLRGPLGIVNGSIGIGAKTDSPPVHMVSMYEADAQLIAAAPDLLEALRELLEAGDDSAMPADGDDYRATMRFGGAVDAARAAIQRATGASA